MKKDDVLREKKTTVMKLGLSISTVGIEDYHEIVELSELAEILGYDSISLTDQPDSQESHSSLEPWMLLPEIAAKTTSLNLSAPVSSDLATRPGVLAKMASSVDLLSKGRLILGIKIDEITSGEEEDELQISSSKNDKLGILEEMLEVLLALWGAGNGQGNVDFAGKYFKLKNAESLPKPYRKRRPPISIEVNLDECSDQRLMEMVAKYADIVSFFSSSSEEVTPAEKEEKEEKLSQSLAALRLHCSKIGRDYDSIQKAVACSVAGDGQNTLSGLAAKLQSYEKFGVTYAFLSFPKESQRTMAEDFATKATRLF